MRIMVFGNMLTIVGFLNRRCVKIVNNHFYFTRAF